MYIINFNSIQYIVLQIKCTDYNNSLLIINKKLLLEPVNFIFGYIIIGVNKWNNLGEEYKY